jgi:hypothetical protein
MHWILFFVVLGPAQWACEPNAVRVFQHGVFATDQACQIAAINSGLPPGPASGQPDPAFAQCVPVTIPRNGQ